MPVHEPVQYEERLAAGDFPARPSYWEDLRRWIGPEELVELSRIKQGRVTAQLALLWLLMLATLLGALWLRTWPMYLVGFLVMGCLHHHLIAWTHEAAHYGLSRRKQPNDLLADLFISGPVGLAIRQYRFVHFRHHRYLGDPEREVDLMAWVCLRGGNLFAEIAKHLVGGYVLRLLGRYGEAQTRRPPGMPRRSPASVASFAVVNLTLFLSCVAWGAWYLYGVLWVLPLFTMALLMTNFRTIVEHQPSSDVCDTGRVPVPAITRCVRSHPLERFIIAPVGFYYHYEHHLVPSIPCHRLGELRRLLQARGHFDQPGIVWVEGYLRTLWRLAMTPGYGMRIS